MSTSTTATISTFTVLLYFWGTCLSISTCILYYFVLQYLLHQMYLTAAISLQIKTLYVKHVSLD